MRDKTNIEQVAALQPDFMGFIFYPKSARYAGEVLEPRWLTALSPAIKKVGVFVNADTIEVKVTMQKFGLQYAQLHGNESPQYCKALQDEGIRIIKAFAVDEDFDFERLHSFEPYCEYFLFDTKTPLYGGSGYAFDWHLLNKYQLDKPFLLGGGVGPANVTEAVAIRHKALLALDVNSRLESAPGIKNIDEVALIKKAIQHKIENH